MRKGQAALEFIMTYGWAILVILVMIGALGYFGVFNAKGLFPEKCVVGPGFECKDFLLTQWTQAGQSAGVEDAEVKIHLVNKLGKSVNITKVNVTHGGSAGSQVYLATCSLEFDYGDCCSDNGTIIVAPDEEFPVYCNPRGSKTFVFGGVGVREKINFEISYIEVGGRYEHSVFGEINAEVQAQIDQYP